MPRTPGELKLENLPIEARAELFNAIREEDAIRRREEEIRAKARHQFAADDCQVDANAAISYTDGGAWVQAWVWVSREGDQ